jgi:hypothetical protein
MEYTPNSGRIKCFQGLPHIPLIYKGSTLNIPSFKHCFLLSSAMPATSGGQEISEMGIAQYFKLLYSCPDN